MAQIRIGISGWTYKPWRGVFYPEDLKQARELEFASRQLNSIEINGTHYSLQKPSSFESWKSETPPDFVFSVKGSRFITHIKRLKDPETPLANFFASGVLALEEKLGPFLWQLPPSFKFDSVRIGNFLDILPFTTTDASKLAKKHDSKPKNEAYLKPGKHRRLRHCMEIRHDSFMVPEFFEMLKEHKVAFVFADTAGKWPYAEELTSDFVYLRLHGDEKLYESGYSDEALHKWTDKIRKWNIKRDAFIYFDNDTKVKAPRDAKRLSELLGIDPP